MIDGSWTQRSLDGLTWIPREGHSATFVRGKMYVFGGCELGSECFNDTTVLDTFEPCPANCGGHGECINSQFCRCTVPGFTGHDCMEPLTCQKDCGEHGVCTQNGQCVCERGWTGDKCSAHVEIPLIVKAPVVLEAIRSVPAQISIKKTVVGGVNGHQKHFSVGHQNHSSVGKQAALQTQVQRQRYGGPVFGSSSKSASTQFGVGAVSDDTKEVQAEEKVEIECVDSCNFRGLCDGGACYCQPGFYGEYCQVTRDVGGGTISILVCVLICLVCFIVVFIATVIFMYIREKAKRKTEATKGFMV